MSKNRIAKAENSVLNDHEINGCGGKGSRIRPPYRLFFKASCDKHDIGYDIGGDKIDRWYCDVSFYNAMRYDVKKAKPNYFQRQYFLIWCKIYFISVRLFGAKYFNFKNKNQT